MATLRPGWTALGACVRGASHESRRQPNQDSLAWSPGTGSGPPLVLAVADGHGDPRSFLSQFGAELATAAACRLALARLEAVSPMGTTRTDWLEFAADLVSEWQNAVRNHRATAGPLLETGLRSLEAAGDTGARAALAANPFLAYGTTLLFAVLSPGGILYGQLGDGDIVEFTAAGEAVRPIPPDPTHVANATTSLCSPDAAREFRFRARPVGSHLPLALLLATDGYANSFKDPAGFLQVGPDLLAAVRAEGLPAVRRDLPLWLAETSRGGSGDDIAAGLILAPEALSEQVFPSPPPHSREETDG